MNSGEDMTPRKHSTRRIKRKQQATAAIELTGRYRLSTASTVASLRKDLFPNEDIASQVLMELCREHILYEATLYADKNCYILAPASNVQAALSENSKLRAYAMLAVCATRKHNRTRLTSAEFQKYFPDLCRPGLPMNYYVDLTAPQPVMGFIRVDTGGQSRWDRIVAKAQDDARKHRLEPAYERFIQRNAFEIRITTPLPQKADRIRRAIADKPNPIELPIKVSVVPELLNLIAPLPS